MQPYAFNIVMPAGPVQVPVGLLCASLAARYSVNVLSAWGINPGAERFTIPRRDGQAPDILAEVTYFPAAAHVRRVWCLVAGPESDTINAYMARLIAEDLGIADRVSFAGGPQIHYPACTTHDANYQFINECIRNVSRFIKDCDGDAETTAQAMNAEMVRGNLTVLHEHRVYDTAPKIAGLYGIAAARMGDVFAVVSPATEYRQLRNFGLVSGVTGYAIDATALVAGTPYKDATVHDMRFEDLPRNVWEHVFAVEDATQQPVRFVILGQSLRQVFHRF